MFLKYDYGGNDMLCPLTSPLSSIKEDLASTISNITKATMTAKTMKIETVDFNPTPDELCSHMEDVPLRTKPILWP